LPLFVTRVGANHPHNALAFHDFAAFAQSFH
jgi:hypothetical protein